MNVHRDMIKIIYIIFFITFGEIIRRKFFQYIDPFFFMWIILSIGSIYYISIAIKYRKQIKERNLIKFDSNKKYDLFFLKEFIIDGFSVFGNNVDNRYLEPNNIVYWGEGINIILSLLLVYFTFFIKSNNSIVYIKNILYGQIILTIGYYLTFTQYKFDTFENIINQCAILPWGLIPLIILLRNKFGITKI